MLSGQRLLTTILWQSLPLDFRDDRAKKRCRRQPVRYDGPPRGTIQHHIVCLLGRQLGSPSHKGPSLPPGTITGCGSGTGTSLLHHQETSTTARLARLTSPTSDVSGYLLALLSPHPLQTLKSASPARRKSALAVHLLPRPARREQTLCCTQPACCLLLPSSQFATSLS